MMCNLSGLDTSHPEWPGGGGLGRPKFGGFLQSLGQCFPLDQHRPSFQECAECAVDMGRASTTDHTIKLHTKKDAKIWHNWSGAKGAVRRGGGGRPVGVQFAKKIKQEKMPSTTCQILTKSPKIDPPNKTSWVQDKSLTTQMYVSVCTYFSQKSTTIPTPTLPGQDPTSTVPINNPQLWL